MQHFFLQHCRHIVPWFTGLAVASAAVLGGAYLSYHASFAIDRKRIKPVQAGPRGLKKDTEKAIYQEALSGLLAVPYETITVCSFDGLTLSGKYYVGAPGAPLVIFFHGYRGRAERDGCGSFRIWQKKGYSVLLVDQRGHGESEGNAISFGIRERRDCLTWAKEAARRFGSDISIILMGVSMGAATVMMSTDLELPAQVCGVIADCGFSAPEAILDDTMRRRHYPLWLTWPLLRLGARLYGKGLNIRSCSALGALAHTNIPVLLIHGEADPIVPCSMAYELRDACASPVTLLTVPGAGHGASCYVNPQAYSAAINAFCEQILPARNHPQS